MKQLLNSGASFSAVLASNDESALGAMQALEEAGKRIPQDVAIIGFDNRLEGAVHEPGLSSVHVPLFNMGYQALKRLFDHLETKTELSGTNKVNTRLVTRTSCGCGTGYNTPSNYENTPGLQLAEPMASIILGQAHSLTDEEGQSLCQQLVDAFATSVQQCDGTIFQDKIRPGNGYGPVEKVKHQSRHRRCIPIDFSPCTSCHKVWIFTRQLLPAQINCLVIIIDSCHLSVLIRHARDSKRILNDPPRYVYCVFFLINLSPGLWFFVDIRLITKK